MIACNGPEVKSTPEIKRFFTDKKAAGFYEWHDWIAEKGLERLVFSVSRNPKNLQAHLERIYFCYQEQLNDQLFGALVDLLIVLNKTGEALANRMVSGCQARLTGNQLNALINLIDNKETRTECLFYSCYSIFSKGLQSTSVLLRLVQDSIRTEQDPLDLARDFVEFSQIDNAVNVLEKAILTNHGRMELHNELLSLYRLTRNQAGFQRFYEELSHSDLTLPVEWKQLNDYFTAIGNVKK